MSENSQNNNGGMLDQIISTPTKNEAVIEKKEVVSQTSSISQQKPKKPTKKPMSPGDFLKFVGAVFAVALIVFASFLAYIVFNPSDAKQFLLMFGINPIHIQALLYNLVNASFGLITLVNSIIWIIFLFKAILTKKEFKKKKTIFVILSLFLGILLFSIITLRVFLIRQIGIADYENPDGGVIIYDNSKLISVKFKNTVDVAKMIGSDFDNVIGPVTLRFDLKADVKHYSQQYKIISYEIDFNGDGKSDKTGSNPEDDQGIMYTYDQVGSFVPKGKYIGKDKITGDTKELEIKLPSINMIGIVDIKQTPSEGGTRITLDASKIQNLGVIKWFSEEDIKGDTPTFIGPKYIKTIKEEQMVCMLIENSKKQINSCDKVFIVGSKSFDGDITINKDLGNPKKITFKIQATNENIQIEPDSYSWVLDSTFRGDTDIFEHKFDSYGPDHKITVTFKDINGKEYTLEKKFDLLSPLALIGEKFSVKGLDSSGTDILNLTFDKDKKFYNVTNFSVPQEINFDASNVKTTDNDYSLSGVVWDFDGDNKFEMVGTNVKFSFVEDKKYEITVRYTFISKLKNDTQDVDEKIVIDAKQKDISIKLNVNMESEQVPAVVRFDASASQARKGKIVRYIYDFGDGKGKAEGGATQDYQYSFAGNYKVKLTVITDDGTEESMIREVVITDSQKKVVINSSISSSSVGKYVDFDAVGTTGQINSYFWDFGDENTSTDPVSTHSFNKPGEYLVKLTVTYADGTIKTGSKTITIRAE
ncbi:MAG: PKD domain-containing protein [Candidatus Gracilibacteria bacterium]|nr:PKD domain-containing protein [Candidatus Gracilibacteria bacterium]MDD3119916.1 PKD domain-containing protein [Candidatus Gracilibacteria bacterium]